MLGLLKRCTLKQSDDTEPISFTPANRLLLIILLIPTTLILGFIGIFYKLSEESIKGIIG